MTAYSEKELWSPESCGLTTNIFLQCLCVNEGNVPVWFIGWMTAWSLCGHLLWFLGKDSTRFHNVIPIRNWLTKAWHDQTKVRRLDSETNGVMVAHNTFLCGVGNEMQSVLTLDSNKNLINKDMCSPYFSIQDWRTYVDALLDLGRGPLSELSVGGWLAFGLTLNLLLYSSQYFIFLCMLSGCHACPFFTTWGVPDSEQACAYCTSRNVHNYSYWAFKTC